MDAAPHAFRRQLESRIAEALADTPVVLVAGPRQAGKTTLVRALAGDGRRYLTLDDELTLLAARSDPTGFVRELDHAAIDEVQRAPGLLLALKQSVDADRRPGRFLITGSANLLMLPTVADSLAGRMETLTLLPLSQAEMHAGRTNWLDAAFDGQLPEVTAPLLGPALTDTVLRGGYPEAVARATPRRRTAWAQQYIDALIQRDVRDIAGVGRLDQLPRLLRALAQVSGQLCNFNQLAGQLGMDHKTAARYAGIFEQMYLLGRAEPWHANGLSRRVKTPKLHFLDSGLLATLLGLTPAAVQADRSALGPVLETFVYSELRKHAATAEGPGRPYRFSHYRDHDQQEVDLVIENAAGRLVGVEVKASAGVQAGDLRGLRQLARAAGSAFAMGVVLHDGPQTLPLGDRLWAAPISGLWA